MASSLLRITDYRPVLIVHAPAFGAVQIAKALPVKPFALQRTSASRN